MTSSHHEELACQGQHRGRIGQLLCYAAVLGIMSHWQPWLCLRRTEIGMYASLPHHRSSFLITPQVQTRHIAFPAVVYVFCRDGHILHPQFVTVVECRRAAQGEQKQHGNTSLPGSKTARHTWLIMIA